MLNLTFDNSIQWSLDDTDITKVLNQFNREVASDTLTSIFPFSSTSVKNRTSWSAATPSSKMKPACLSFKYQSSNFGFRKVFGLKVFIFLLCFLLDIHSFGNLILQQQWLTEVAITTPKLLLEQPVIIKMNFFGSIGIVDELIDAMIWTHYDRVWGANATSELCCPPPILRYIFDEWSLDLVFFTSECLTSGVFSSFITWKVESLN